jgi:hypothetical protein
LSQTELNQITNYAVAVSRDERFRSAGVTWDFELLGDDIHPVVEEVANQKGKPSGLALEGGNYRVWVRRWAEVLEENRQRLHFYRDRLDFRPDEVGDLEETLDKYMQAPRVQDTNT